MIGRNRFNKYLLTVAVLVLAAGCQTSSSESKKDKKLHATLRVHLEASAWSADDTEEASIVRANPVKLVVQKEPILSEADVASAKALDTLVGPAVQLRLRQHGTWILEQNTADNLGRHLAMFCQFGENLGEHRWLGVTKITRRIADGVITFTPDASHEELAQILTGWTNTIKEVDKALK